jgi:hypothetical protein
MKFGQSVGVFIVLMGMSAPAFGDPNLKVAYLPGPGLQFNVKEVPSEEEFNTAIGGLSGRLSSSINAINDRAGGISGRIDALNASLNALRDQSNRQLNDQIGTLTGKVDTNDTAQKKAMEEMQKKLLESFKTSAQAIVNSNKDVALESHLKDLIRAEVQRQLRNVE